MEIFISDGSQSQILIARTDITDVYTAEYDPLTGLYNRQAFYRHVRVILDASQERRFVMPRCDIDRFKAYNDMYGAQAGDRLLQFWQGNKAPYMAGNCGIWIYHADHFCALLPLEEFSSPKWRDCHARWLKSIVPGYQLTSSVGIYEITDPEIEVSLMCDRALLALLTVKESYVSKIAWYD